MALKDILEEQKNLGRLKVSDILDLFVPETEIL